MPCANCVLRLTNNNCYAADKRRLGVQKTTVGRALSAGTPFVWFSSPTFFCARKMLRIFSRRAQKNVSYLERYMQFALG